jgi:hypothetical protein
MPKADAQKRRAPSVSQPQWLAQGQQARGQGHPQRQGQGQAPIQRQQISPGIPTLPGSARGRLSRTTSVVPSLSGSGGSPTSSAGGDSRPFSNSVGRIQRPTLELKPRSFSKPDLNALPPLDDPVSIFGIFSHEFSLECLPPQITLRRREYHFTSCTSLHDD